jgi:hypothetical protein
LGFAIVSLLAFGFWAFAEKWFHGKAAEVELYGATACVFIMASGPALHRLLAGPRSLLRFYGVFIPAFVAYAVTWCAAWFLLRFGAGEWLGSLCGTFVLVLVMAWRLGNCQGLPKAAMTLFIFHSAGYFGGGQATRWLTHHGANLFPGLAKAEISVVAKLAWGLCYGLGFGIGLGYALYVLQRARGARGADSPGARG